VLSYGTPSDSMLSVEEEKITGKMLSAKATKSILIVMGDDGEVVGYQVKATSKLSLVNMLVSILNADLPTIKKGR
jgi:hypothetical protein